MAMDRMVARLGQRDQAFYCDYGCCHFRVGTGALLNFNCMIRDIVEVTMALARSSAFGCRSATIEL
jgi:hypothetical protein